jgi:hypothetical protein
VDLALGLFAFLSRARARRPLPDVLGRDQPALPGLEIYELTDNTVLRNSTRS